MENVVIRIAEPNDFESIFKIWEENQELAIGQSIKLSNNAKLRTDLYQLFELKHGYYFVAELKDSKKIIGWQSLLPLISNPIIKNFIAQSSTYVDKTYHDSALGSELLAYVLKFSAKTEIRQIYGWLKSNNVAMHKIVENFGIKKYATIPPSTDNIIPEFDLYVYFVP